MYANNGNHCKLGTVCLHPWCLEWLHHLWRHQLDGTWAETCHSWYEQEGWIRKEWIWEPVWGRMLSACTHKILYKFHISCSCCWSNPPHTLLWHAILSMWPVFYNPFYFWYHIIYSFMHPLLIVHGFCVQNASGWGCCFCQEECSCKEKQIQGQIPL